MQINNIKPGSNYIFKLDSTDQKNIPTNSGNIPSGFYTKYPTWGDVDGKTVTIISKHSTGVKFSVLGDANHEWAVARPDFFSPLRPTSSPLSGCKCNLWMAGCQCGVFQAEQQPNPPKKRTWRYIDSSTNLEEDPF